MLLKKCSESTQIISYLSFLNLNSDRDINHNNDSYNNSYNHRYQECSWRTFPKAKHETSKEHRHDIE